MKPSCLICQSPDCDTVDSLTSEELVKLWNLLDRPVHESDLLRCNCAGSVELLECRACGFQFFDPGKAGDGLFYQRLDVGSGLYYNHTRPEFDVALRHARANAFGSVLDIGCGSGSFLDLAGRQGLMTHGMELNIAAADEASSKGHSIFQSLLTDEFVQRHPDRYDLITLFQVVEHVPDPVEILRNAKHLLTTSGMIMISVPNRDGICRLFPLNPHEWPPHHISRWRTSDFGRLASSSGLVLRGVGGDPTYGSSIYENFLLNEQARKEINRPPSGCSPHLVRLFSFIYRKLGLKHIVSNRGLSIYAYFSNQ